MQITLRTLCAVLFAGAALATQRDANAQYPTTVTTVAPAVVGYSAERRGLFGRRMVYRPVVTQAAYTYPAVAVQRPVVSVAQPVVTVARPVVTVARPVVTVARPVVTVARPVYSAPVVVPVQTYRVPITTYSPVIGF